MSKRENLEKQIQDNNIENYRHEYSEICQFLRHYSSLRFAILTVFFAVLAGLIMLGFNENVRLEPPYLIRIIRIAGSLITLIFWIFGEVSLIYTKVFSQRARELEQKLAYQSLLRRHKSIFPYATRSLYFIIESFWVYSIFI